MLVLGLLLLALFGCGDHRPRPDAGTCVKPCAQCGCSHD